LREKRKKRYTKEEEGDGVQEDIRFRGFGRPTAQNKSLPAGFVVKRMGQGARQGWGESLKTKG